MVDKYVYRRARLEDKVGVLAINENFADGTDVLPYLYTDLILSRDVDAYVCEDRGKIIAFGYRWVIDGGETSIGRSARVLESYQRSGVLIPLLRSINTQRRTLKYGLFCTDDKQAIGITNFLKRTHFLPVSQEVDYLYFTADSQIPSNIKINQEIDIANVVPDMLCRIINSPKLCDYLFPDGFLKINNMYHQLNSQFVHEYFTTNVRISASFLNDKTEENEHNLENVRLLTICHLYPCKYGFACSINIYGSKTADFNSHLAKYIDSIRQITNGNVVFKLITSPTLDISVIDEFMKTFSRSLPPVLNHIYKQLDKYKSNL